LKLCSNGGNRYISFFGSYGIVSTTNDQYEYIGEEDIAANRGVANKVMAANLRKRDRESSWKTSVFVQYVSTYALQGAD